MKTYTACTGCMLSVLLSTSLTVDPKLGRSFQGCDGHMRKLSIPVGTYV